MQIKSPHTILFFWRKLKVKAKRLALGCTGKDWVPFWEVDSRILTQNKCGSELSQGLLRRQIPSRVRTHLTTASAATCGFCP